MSKRGEVERITEMRDWYVSNFRALENRLNGHTNAPFHEMRKTAISRFAEFGFPTRRNEEWKYTSVLPLLKYKFELDAQPTEVSADTVQDFAFEQLSDNLVVFVNGRYSADLSTYTPTAKGMIVDGLENRLEDQSEIVNKNLSKFAKIEKQADAFVALNTAFARDGALIFIPDDVVLKEPLHLVYLTDSSQSSFYTSPRNLIVVGKNSQAKLVESHHYLGDNAYFNNAVTEIVVRENANVEHVKIQDESRKAYHLHALETYQQKGSIYSLVNIDMGGALVRNNLNITIDEEHGESHIIGFYMGTKKQHIDNHTLIRHLKPNCYSNELYKGILGGKATGVFNGKIYVNKDAQKTNAYQNNKALLLTDDATVNSKPELEIFADDVVCSHGATVGQLDAEALFYLQSRGIPKDKAQAILQYAFASDVFNYITIDSVREHLENMISHRFSQL